MSTKKKKSESRTKLPDGSTIREYETEETHPDGTKVITTTTLRSYDKVKTLDDGSQVVERVNTTTTTTRECSNVAREPNAIESAVTAVGAQMGGFLDMFNTAAAPNEARDDQHSLTATPTERSCVSRKEADDEWSRLSRADSRLSTDSDQVALRARHSSQMRGLRKQRSGSSRELAPSTPGSMPRPSRGSRDFVESTPGSRRSRDEPRQAAERQMAPQHAGRSPGGVPSTSFFQKTHPGGGNDAFHNQQQQQQSNVYQQRQQQQSYHDQQQPNNSNQCHNIYGDTNDTNSPGDVRFGDMHNMSSPGDVRCIDTAGFAVYENDRCEQLLPTFHKVREPQPSRGRSLMRSMSGSSSARDVNRNIKLGLSSTGRGRPGRSRSRRQRQRDRENPNVLDPEVVAAIGVMQDRSKSPVDRRGRSRGVSSGRQGQRSMQQSEEFDPFAGQRIGDALGIDWQAGQSTPRSQQPSTMHSPTAPMYANSPRQQQGYSQRNNVVHRGVGNANQFPAQNNPPMSAVPRTPAGPGAVDFDGLPLGNLRNPIPWDDVSDFTGARTPESALQGTTGSGRRRALSRGRSKSRGRSARSKSASRLRSAKSTDSMPVPPPTKVKYKQCLLPSDFAVDVTPPKIAIDGNNAIVTSDKFVHFYSLLKNKWTQTTTVSLQNTHRLSLALSGDTAVIGVPYDRNAKGFMTGSAYIFERDPKSHSWYQVKKIVPKRAQEYATVGYSVDICDNVVVIGAPELGLASNAVVMNGSMGGGSVYMYRRTGQSKWAPAGHLTPNNPNTIGLPLTSGFGAIVTLRSNMLVVSNYHPDIASGETSLFVYEYDPLLRSKWRLVQTDLLSTEGQRQNFGSRIALTRNGESLFIGCHSNVSPTEILCYRRKGLPDVYGNRGYELRQILTVAEKCDISDMAVDENDALILGTTNENRAYVYQQMHDLNTMENQGWRLVAKVVNGPNLNGFGTNVGLSGDRVLVGSTSNVHSYSLEAWMKKRGKQQDKQLVPSSNSSQARSRSVGKRGLMGSMRSLSRSRR
ncbi:hypothetical protein ACHAXT_007994 [Thalassiosira profunda]